jgi:hypothetical protein
MTVDELKAAVNPALMRELSSEAQHPRIAEQIVDDEARYYGDRNKWFDGVQDKKAIVQRFEQILRYEIAKTDACKGRIGALGGLHASGKLDTILDNADNVVPPSSYGAVDGDDDVTLASKWVCSSSNTMKGGGGAAAVAIRKIIAPEVASNRPLSIDHADRLWRLLIPSPKPTVRHINENAAAPLLCDKLGHAKLVNAITMKLAAKDSIGKALYLMAVAIRTHGYPDGNGRIARVLYAISLLRGLPPIPAEAPAKPTWIQEGYGRYKKVGPAGAAAKSRFLAPTSKCTSSLVQM